MNLIVTGGSGFIGSHFVKLILQNHKLDEHQVFNIDKMGYGSNADNLSENANDPHYLHIKADINNVSSIRELKDRKIDAIVNFAAETHVDRSISDPSPFLDSNYYGTFRLLEYARKKNIGKFIQISTDEVYGEAEDHSFKETDSLNPGNPYSASKAAADLLVKSYSRTYGIPAIITRCTNNFGPNQFPEKLIPKTIIRILRGEPIVLYGHGKQIRDWLYVKDHVRAVYSVLNNGHPGEIYNIAGLNSRTNITIVEKVNSLIKKKTGKESKIEFVDDRPGHDKKYALDPSKIKEDLGWQPLNDFDGALEETVDWYLEEQRWWKKLITADTLHSQPWKINWDTKARK